MTRMTDEAIEEFLGGVKIMGKKVDDPQAWQCIQLLVDVCGALHSRVLELESTLHKHDERIDEANNTVSNIREEVRDLDTRIYRFENK